MFGRADLRDDRDGCLTRLHREACGSLVEVSRASGVPVRTLASWCASHGLNRDSMFRVDPPSNTPLEAVGRDLSPFRLALDESPQREEHAAKPARVETWGLGGPATLHLPPKQGDYTVVGIFDTHGEWIEEKLFEAQLRLIRDVKPDLTIFGGDIDNFDIISRWQEKILRRKTPLEIKREIEREIEIGKRQRARVREAVGTGLFIETEGNHCDRLRKYLSDDLEEGWETSKAWRGVDDVLDGYYNRAGVFIRPRFLVRHGDTTSINPAKKEYAISRCSGWSGHLHNAHQHYEKPFALSGERFTHTIAPATCRLDANYGSGNAGLMGWHQGCLVGTFSASNPHDHATDIGLWNGSSLLVRGERY